MDKEKKSHAQLVARSCSYLRYHFRCNPVLTEHASCLEVPDAIGWKGDGSIVIECKTSVADYRNDAEKYIAWRSPESELVNYWTRKKRKRYEPLGYVPEPIARMGTWRYFLCVEGLIKPEMIEKDHPDHGLLWLKGNQIKQIRAAQKREPDFEAEVRLLRLALVHVHKKLCGLGVLCDIDDLTRVRPRNYIPPVNNEVTREFEEAELGFKRQRKLFE